jgi:hypothetical protein
MADLFLSRFETTVLEDKVPGSDPAQVPASAAITFYKQGPTLEAAVTISAGATHVVDVYALGHLI